MEKAYRKLIVWQKADELAYHVYIESKKFPREEVFGLTSQLRRAVISVPTNIVEGMGRQGRNERKQFINIAIGSLMEVEYLLDFCFRVQHLSKEGYQKLEAIRKNVGALLWGLYRSIS